MGVAHFFLILTPNPNKNITFVKEMTQDFHRKMSKNLGDKIYEDFRKPSKKVAKYDI